MEVSDLTSDTLAVYPATLCYVTLIPPEQDVCTEAKPQQVNTPQAKHWCLAARKCRAILRVCDNLIKNLFLKCS